MKLGIYFQCEIFVQMCVCVTHVYLMGLYSSTSKSKFNVFLAKYLSRNDSIKLAMPHVTATTKPPFSS